jgi:hypothetical protein
MKILIAFFIVHSMFSQTGVGTQPQSVSNSRKLVNDFYSWYIKNAYQTTPSYYQIPPFKRLATSQYVFDRDELAKRLNKISYLSEAYKKGLLDKLNECNHQMKKRKWQHEPEPQFNITECDYLWYDNWVGGQGEKVDGFNIVKENPGSSTTDFIVEILINKKVFSRSRVTVGIEERDYKILNIELIWN